MELWSVTHSGSQKPFSHWVCAAGARCCGPRWEGHSRLWLGGDPLSASILYFCYLKVKVWKCCHSDSTKCWSSPLDLPRGAFNSPTVLSKQFFFPSLLCARNVAPPPDPGAPQAVVWPSANGDSLHIGPGSPRCLLKLFYQARTSEAPPLPCVHRPHHSLSLFWPFLRGIFPGCHGRCRGDGKRRLKFRSWVISSAYLRLGSSGCWVVTETQLPASLKGTLEWGWLGLQSPAVETLQGSRLEVP